MAECRACGAAKDLEALETYPYPGDGIHTGNPITPLLEIDCQGSAADEDGLHIFRVAAMCHECFHKLDADMWISEEQWAELNPKTPFDALPECVYGGDEDA